MLSATWIDGKRGALKRSEVAPSLAGFKIEVNEKLPVYTRQIYSDARHTIREG